jgi:hypothetical protein
LRFQVTIPAYHAPATRPAASDLRRALRFAIDGVVPGGSPQPSAEDIASLRARLAALEVRA